MSYRPPAPVRPQRTAGRPIYSRHRRRAPRYRLLVVITVLVLLVVLGLRACQGSGSGPDLTGYVDTARVFIQRSNDTGTAFKRLPTDIDTLTRADLADRLDKWARDAQAVSDDALKSFTNVPPAAIAAHGYLLTSLKARAVGLVELKPAMLQASVIDDQGLAALSLQGGISKLAFGDEAYSFFTDEVKSRLAKAKEKSEVPASTFVEGTDFAKPERVDGFLKKLRTSEKLKATRDVGIASFKTHPDSVGAPDPSPSGDVYRLPPAEAFELLVTVKNKGNQRVESVFVKATLVSSVNPTPRSKSGTISAVDAGDVSQIALEGLQPDRGDAINKIDIEVGGVDTRDPIDSTKSFLFRMDKR